MNSKILILGFHRVGYPPRAARIRGLFTSPRLLAFELWLLSKLGYQFSTLKDAMIAPMGKIAAITFDDGYEDNFLAALPILERFNAPATIFVITHDVGKKNVVWAEADEKLPADMISWRMLAVLQQKGWEIGSHGHRHVHFDAKRPSEQESLICHSVTEIEDALGTIPISFAYPYGSFNDTTKTILRRFGIRFAVTTIPPRSSDTANPDNLLELKRVAIGGRKFHHFIKAILRTFKAIGMTDVVRSLALEPLIRMVPQRMVRRRF
ncbi:MAG TPA: polysaccharide deacetylase family protein [Pyrinomonadaceae bacterium]|nr:polysaccharide deacetylase family protein [Pyrinomonadaceae bacterium]